MVFDSSNVDVLYFSAGSFACQENTVSLLLSDASRDGRPTVRALDPRLSQSLHVSARLCHPEERLQYFTVLKGPIKQWTGKRGLDNVSALMLETKLCQVCSMRGSER